MNSIHMCFHHTQIVCFKLIEMGKEIDDLNKITDKSVSFSFFFTEILRRKERKKKH